MQTKINDLIQSIPLSKLRELRNHITRRYKHKSQRCITSEDEAIAYLAFRSPATTAVQKYVFKEIKDKIFPKTVIDLGAGIGLSYEIGKIFFPTIESYTGIEENPYMINLGKKLNPQVNWIQSNYLKENLPMADLVLGSYTFSELPKTDLEMALEKSWQTTKQCLVLIEPGTPEGFQTILKCRDYLIKNGGFIYAPCGHNGSCPIGLKNDWCHFSARLERSKLHRDMKEGSLPYEDEKYSYLVATKENWKPTYQRILRPSMTRKGHIVLDVCTPENIESKTYTKSKDKNFKDIKKLNWGDRLEIPK